MSKSKKIRSVKFEDLTFPSLKSIKTKIGRKLGNMPGISKDLPKGEWSEQAIKVLGERYLARDGRGEVWETPEEMCWRVAWEIASADVVWGASRAQVIAQAKEYYRLLVSRKFLPNSPTLMNAGTGNDLQYSACFVLPVEDSMEGIFDAIKWQALIHKSGGGTGFSFSRLRSSGSMVKSSGGVASGPVSFMRIFDAATNEVKQGGKRRGANMGILRVDHPDILEFIHCKEEGGITNFNISVAITDEFMRAYEKDQDYNLVDPKTKKAVGKLSARQVFDEIADGAWRTGDPGLIFIDRINSSTPNPVPSLGPVESTNPCGEVPLYPFDSCNLGSIFLNLFVKEIDGKKEIDWEELKRVSRLATRFLDGVIEMNPYPLEQIRKTSLAIRRVGVGVGGWADMLVELGIPYDCEEAIQLGEKVMRLVQEEGIKESQKLARERGAFPLWSQSMYRNDKPRRNSTITTIAPTGTISIIAGSSSGIEPLFAVAYQHIVKDKHLDRTLNFVNPYFVEIAKKRGFWNKEVEVEVINHGTVRELASIPEEVRAVFGTAHEIDYKWHIRMQSVFQIHTENAVSKTINMIRDATISDVKEAYLTAWNSRCFGITVFRDGCKEAQVLNAGVKADAPQVEGEKKDVIYEEPIRQRPLVVTGSTYKLKTPVGTAFLTINQDQDGEPLEIFINVGKAGSEITAFAEALGRTISTALRFKGNLSARERAREIAYQLAGIGGRRSIGFGPSKILSLPDAIATAISTHFGFRMNGEVHTNGQTNGHSSQVLAGQILFQEEEERKGEVLIEAVIPSSSSRDICPSCGASAYVYEEGCSKCYACGHSEC